MRSVQLPNWRAQAQQQFARAQEMVAEGHALQAQAQIDYARAEGALAALKALGQDSTEHDFTRTD